ncbi:Short chain dehydrogenase asqE [Colletotrichum aenigma]|uniref:Short chain dehydrogenase asqE n=1 Tax=Colletotrichum aenigma TaxID=1215731 RepID=UPI0018727A1C|nr:Short chain dehydrogenase asqE [Colletotrichum aenigma]KAF5524332.1 Short chain dehydrogenase asqE [Colletotrichum aenigma]
MSSSENASAIQPWSLSGKTALITGASRGIGKAIAIYLARKGLANIAITYASNKAAAEDTLDQCRTHSIKKAVALQVDALDPTAWPTVVKDSIDALGVSEIDILVNNAIWGSFQDFKPAGETTAEDFTKAMIANVYSPVATIVEFMKHAPKTGGRVINISSVAAREANNDPIITYGACKATLDSYTRSFAGSFATDTGITFNTVVVGPTATDALVNTMSALPAEYEEKLKASASAAYRMGVPDDVAYIVGFLASDESKWVNGAAVSANGGYRSLLAALG